MENVLLTFLDYIFCLIDCAFAMYVFYAVFDHKNKGYFNKFFNVIFTVVLSIILNVCILNDYQVIGSICIMISFIIYNFIFMIGNAILKIFLPIICLLGNILSELIIMSLYVIVFDYNLSALNGDITTEFLLTLLSRFLVYFVALGISKRKIVLMKDSSLGYLYYFIIPMISVLGITALFDQYCKKNTNNYFIIFTIILIIINFLSFSLLYYLSLQSNKLIEAEIEINNKKLEEGQYKQAISAYESLRRWKHDILGHLSTIDFALDVSKKEAHDYIKGLNKKINSECFLINSGNFYLDAILNNKINEMINENIVYELEFQIASLDNIDKYDITSLFSNLLDNAIEAAKQCEHRYVCLKMSIHYNMLFITCKNSCLEPPVKKGNKFISTKIEKGHGVGMETMRMIAEKYQGYFKPEYRDHIFETRIMLACEYHDQNMKIVHLKGGDYVTQTSK